MYEKQFFWKDWILTFKFSQFQRKQMKKTNINKQQFSCLFLSDVQLYKGQI